MVSKQLRILRVFGLSPAEINAILREAQSEGCPGLRLLEKDGEYAVCVQASAPTQAMADEHCNRWIQRLAGRFGDAVYADGETSLAQATLDALLKKRRLLVAADETSGRLLGPLLRPLNHCEAAFDFGTQTYADPANARKIITPPTLLKRFPGDVVQAAAGRAQLAMMVGQADLAAVYMPATVGQAPFVLVCDRRGAAAWAITPELSDTAIANNILDLVRRRTLGLKLPQGAIQFRPGHEHPLLVVSPAGQEKPGDTTRFSLRRKNRTGTRSGFEPMMDFTQNTQSTGRTQTGDISRSAAQAAAAAVAAAWGEEDDPDSKPEPPQEQQDAGTGKTADRAARMAASVRAAVENSADSTSTRKFGTITFETDEVARAAEQARKAGDTSVQPPLDFTTAGADNAAQHRAARKLRTGLAGQKPAAGAETADTAPDTGRGKVSPPHSILDDEVPDLTEGLDPEAVRAAQKADEAQRPRSLEDFQNAVEQLYDTDVRAEDSAAEQKRTPRMSAGQARSMARIEKAERRQQRSMMALLAVFVLVVVVATVSLVFYLATSAGAKPSPRSYGTAGFDTDASAYLAAAGRKQEDVVGYLAFPDLEGELVYTAAATAEDASARPQITGTSYLGSEYAANTVLTMNNTLLDGLSDLETLRANAGFTLYLGDGTYRCKTLAVYYIDPAETGEGAFSLSGADLSQYDTYLDFVLGVRIRSLFDTDITITDGSSFLTLVSAPDADGVSLCVTGRIIGENEDAQLATAPIQPRDNPLLPAVRYAASGETMPAVSDLLQQQLDWYANVSVALPAFASEGETSADATAAQPGTDAAADPQALSQNVEELQSETNQLMDDVDTLLDGLTDRAGQEGAAESDVHQGAEGTLPEQEISVEQLTAGSATATATPAPESGSTDSGAGSQPAAQATPAPDTSQNSAPAAETINVTMNGSQQTLDLVTCLAMIAQNELGANAPAEAYKAQCVAAHCWILSQGGYPSVAGTTPGSAALAAAQEVAHVLVTYNNNVCFTPYFASASTGTASAADVWGNDRPWLQAVDSPYDSSTASHWNTNGATSGTARFSRATLQQRILDVLGIDLNGVDPNNWFKILSANQYGWVTQMQIGPDGGPNTTCKGTWFRENLLAGQSVDGRSLRSQCFTVSYDASSDCFIFDVYGYGHGCGMSQWGAVGYANNGWTYQQILQHYYPGTTLTTY